MEIYSNNELELFEQLAIRPTSVRLMVYRAISKFRDTFSAQDLEDELSWMDRSSIFRAVSLFSEKGLIHAVDDGGGIKRYCLCKSIGKCNSQKMHCHFHCEKCGKTLCLDGVYMPSIDLPKGFITTHTSSIISGVCPMCSKI